MRTRDWGGDACSERKDRRGKKWRVSKMRVFDKYVSEAAHARCIDLPENSFVHGCGRVFSSRNKVVCMHNEL